MSRTVSERESQEHSVRPGRGLRELTMHELVGKSGRDRHQERRKEPIVVDFAYCAVCDESASGVAARPFHAHHKLKHAPRPYNHLQQALAINLVPWQKRLIEHFDRFEALVVA